MRVQRRQRVVQDDEVRVCVQCTGDAGGGGTPEGWDGVPWWRGRGLALSFSSCGWAREGAPERLKKNFATSTLCEKRGEIFDLAPDL